MLLAAGFVQHQVNGDRPKDSGQSGKQLAQQQNILSHFTASLLY
jgi:hypothetical protein